MAMTFGSLRSSSTSRATRIFGSETFERKAENAFSVQDQIARAIANALDVEISASASSRGAPTANMEAYRLFLEGRELFRLRRRLEDLMGSVALYKRAIKLDPKFAEAHAALALSYSAAMVTDFSAYKHFRELSRTEAETAIKLNPSLAQPHALLAGFARSEFDWEAALAHTAKALSLDPADSISLYSNGMQHLMTGYITEAARILGDAQRVDPLYAFLQTGTFQAAFAQGDDAACFDLAIKLTRSGAVYGRAGHFYLADRARRQGDHTAAEKHYRAWAKFIGNGILEPVVVALKSPAAVPAAIKAINEAREKNPALSPVTLLIVGAQLEYLEALELRKFCETIGPE